VDAQTRTPEERRKAQVRGLIPNTKGNRRVGRQKGAVNKTTRMLKEAILLAAEAVGENKKGKGKLVGYLMFLAKKHPETFSVLLGKLLPLQVNAKVDATSTLVDGTDVTKLPVGELAALYREKVSGPLTIDLEAEPSS
jgi:hypothetical protein